MAWREKERQRRMRSLIADFDDIARQAKIYTLRYLSILSKGMFVKTANRLIQDPFRKDSSQFIKSVAAAANQVRLEHQFKPPPERPVPLAERGLHQDACTRLREWMDLCTGGNKRRSDTTCDDGNAKHSKGASSAGCNAGENIQIGR